MRLSASPVWIALSASCCHVRLADRACTSANRAPAVQLLCAMLAADAGVLGSANSPQGGSGALSDAPCSPALWKVPSEQPYLTHPAPGLQ